MQRDDTLDPARVVPVGVDKQSPVGAQSAEDVQEIERSLSESQVPIAERERVEPQARSAVDSGEEPPAAGPRHGPEPLEEGATLVSAAESGTVQQDDAADPVDGVWRELEPLLRKKTDKQLVGAMKLLRKLSLDPESGHRLAATLEEAESLNAAVLFLRLAHAAYRDPVGQSYAWLADYLEEQAGRILSVMQEYVEGQIEWTRLATRLHNLLNAEKEAAKTQSALSDKGTQTKSAVRKLADRVEKLFVLRCLAVAGLFHKHPRYPELCVAAVASTFSPDTLNGKVSVDTSVFAQQVLELSRKGEGDNTLLALVGTFLEQVRGQQSELRRVERELAVSRVREDELQSQLQATRTEVRRLREELDTKRSELEQLRSALSALESQYKWLESASSHTQRQQVHGVITEIRDRVGHYLDEIVRCTEGYEDSEEMRLILQLATRVKEYLSKLEERYP